MPVASVSELFAQLSLTKYLSAFQAEEYLVDDLLLLSADDLKQLIPAAGPRLRLTNWIKQQQQQQKQQSVAHRADLGGFPRSF